MRVQASSGINALNVAGGDSTELFETDTIQSGGGRSKPDLVATLVVREHTRIASWLTRAHMAPFSLLATYVHAGCVRPSAVRQMLFASL